MAPSFIGHDNLDEDSNNPHDVDVLPTSLIRHEKDHRFTIMQLHLPWGLKIEDGPALLSELIPEWLIVPDNLEQFIAEVPGTHHRCGYRISKPVNEQKWNLDSWPLEHRPQEGDWLLAGPGDKTNATDHAGAGVGAFVPMDEIALSTVFLEGNLSVQIFYVARSVQKILADEIFFEYMLKRGPVVFTHLIDGVSIFGNQNSSYSKPDESQDANRKNKKLRAHIDPANFCQAYTVEGLTHSPHY